MNNKLSSLISRFNLLAGIVMIMLAIPMTAGAQQTSAAVRGSVATPEGDPAIGAVVTVTDTRTSATRTTTTNTDGTFNVRGLTIGGPFTITVTSAEYKQALVTGVYTNLSEVATFNISLEPGEIEEIVVTASAVFAGTDIALGPNATFSLTQLQSLPAINRNINDVIRTDARIYVDESRGDVNGIQCAGKNERFNALTLDGVRVNDSFGLNSNGFPTERMPFPYDAINQVSVELAPFDVDYGGFSACNINAVTKSGGNEFSGSAFYDYTNDDLRGDSLEGDPIQSGSYDESRYGFTFGGPIVRDKLFFFVAYEKLDGANLFDRGPLGSGAVNEVQVTQSELNEIVRIANEDYLYDPGPIPASLDHEDEKILLKLDWNINEEHRLSFTYNFNDGENFTESDDETIEFEFENHLYERGAELNSYVGTLYSDWTDNFSTEIRIARLEMDNRQISVGGTDFGEIRVALDDRPNPDNPSETLSAIDIYLGGDDSRQSNKLDYDLTNIAFKGTYDLGRHSLSFGIEQDALDINNLFIQHSETEIRFDGIANFEAGLADAIYYNNAPSNDPNDARAIWGYEINSVYIQDELDMTDRLSIVFGLRYDWYTTDDRPTENPTFLADYGFTNAQTVDGEGLLQPRFGFTFDWTDTTTIRGGIGLYSGGNPNVWLSNNYSANNVDQVGTRGRLFCYTDSFSRAIIDCGTPPVQRSLFDADVVYEAIESTAPAGAGPGWGIPQEMYQQVTTGIGDNFELNYLDPAFELPREWKFALGLTHTFGDDWLFTADFLYTQGEEMAIVLRGDLEQTGTDADGYPQYDSVREPSFKLTNSQRTASSYSLAFGLAKAFDNGFDFSVGYNYNDAEDVNPMTSSVAFSNYTNRAFFDPQEDVLSTSNYNIEHRFTATATWNYDIADRFPLVVSLFGMANSGRPYSYAFNGTFIPYFFTPFLDDLNNVLEPGDQRNFDDGSWWRKIDLYANLGFPGFAENHRASVFLNIDNLTNLLNDDWGVLKQYPFPHAVPKGSVEPRIGDASRYEIRFGVRYDF
jgi:outer membrane receptor for ferrienterochelin and colicin